VPAGRDRGRQYGGLESLVILLHLLPEQEWLGLPEGTATYAPASLATEGFVHCTSGDDPMLQVARAFYAEVGDALVVLSLDADRLTQEIRWEEPVPAAPPGATVTLFPHVYGPLDLTAVVGVRRLRRDAMGRFVGFEPYEPSA
jgi:uncharacterized protein (DUF952 family)